MDHAARGATALSQGDALTAVSAYTQALIQHPSSPDYFVQRSTAFTRLKAPHGPQHELALKDAEYAVLLGQKRARREKIQAGQRRRVIALFGLEQYGNANFLLGTMERWRTKEKKDIMEGALWQGKLEQRLKTLPDDHQARRLTVKEYPEIELTGDSAVKKMLQAQLKPDGSFRYPGEVEDASSVAGTTTDITAGEPAKSPEPAPAEGIKVDHETTVSTEPAIAPSSSSQQVPKIRNEWFQNAQNVTVTIYAKGVQKDKADIEINDDSISISFPHPANPASTFTFTLDPLFDLIDAAASKSSIMSTKIELTLRKKVPGQKWGALEGVAPLKVMSNDTTQTRDAHDDAHDDAAKAAVMATLNEGMAKTPAETAPSYPTSSKSGPKNWDKVASDLTAKKSSSHKHGDKDKAEKAGGTDSNDNPDGDDDDADSDFGGDPVDGFFKKLYAGADDDTRRAMMKSYQESGGTALSTDWKDVGKRRVDPVESKKD
jgi:suppressor of G2 allele of SKP1